jgi:hypothetical protein
MESLYQLTGPGMDDVIEIIKNHKHLRHVNKEKYKDLINNIIQDEFIKYSGFGSYRGFYTFTLHSLIESIEIAILNKIKYNIAMRKLTNSVIIKQWVNHILYRLPNDASDEKRGLRIDKLKLNFKNSRIV